MVQQTRSGPSSSYSGRYTNQLIRLALLYVSMLKLVACVSAVQVKQPHLFLRPIFVAWQVRTSNSLDDSRIGYLYRDIEKHKYVLRAIQV